jgi:transposase
MGQNRSYKADSNEFKKEAVALICDQGYSVAEASKSLSVASNMLYRWKDQQEPLSAGTTLAEDERAEL